MRRKDREVTDLAEKLAILNRYKVCRLAMTDGQTPYVVPLNYGFAMKNGVLTLYLHCAHEGHKIDILRCNPKVCFVVDGAHELTEGDIACAYSYRFESVIGFGTVDFVEAEPDKIEALNHLMAHQTGRGAGFTYAPEHLKAVTVLKLTVDSFTGKRKA